MKHRERLLARARHEVKSNAQSIVAIESALQSMAAAIAPLDQHVRTEETRTRITDPKHSAYSTVARAARARSDNLKKSLAELGARLRVATADRESALTKVAALENEQPPQVIQLPLSDRNTGSTQRRESRVRIYPVRTVTVIAPSNDNLAALAVATSAGH